MTDGQTDPQPYGVRIYNEQDYLQSTQLAVIIQVWRNLSEYCFTILNQHGAKNIVFAAAKKLHIFMTN